LLVSTTKLWFAISKTVNPKFPKVFQAKSNASGLRPRTGKSWT
jgi:hypothetical protein